MVRPVNLLIILLTQALFIAKGAGWMQATKGNAFLAFINLNPDLIRWPSALFLILSTLAAAAAGNVINDIQGQVADSINKPDKQIVGKIISTRLTWTAYLLLIAISLSSAYMVDIVFFIFTAAVNLLLYYYSSDLKSMPPAGSVLIAILTSSVVFVARKGLEDASTLPFSEFAILAFMLNLARELVKDVNDIPGDRIAGVRSFAIVYGKVSTLKIACFTLLISCIFMLLFALFYSNSLLFQIHLFLATGGAFKLAIDLYKKNTKMATATRIKWLMLFGLISVIWL
jgi:4-hydroxybenzoate polyprenyltransferase